MSGYRYWSFDLVSKKLYGQLPLVGTQLTTTINTPGAFSAKLYPQSVFPPSWQIESLQDALDDERAIRRLEWLLEAQECGKTLIIAEYDNTIAGSAICWKWTYNSEQQGQPAYYSIQGAETISYLQYRFYRGNTGAGDDAVNSGFSVDLTDGVDQVTGTLKAILDYAQQGYGNIGIGTDELVPSGVTNQESYDPTKRDSLFTLLSNLAATIDGPDFWVDTKWVGNTKVPVLEMVAGYPKIGVHYDGTNARNIPHYRYPGNVLYYTSARDGTLSASVCDEISKDSSGVTTVATQTNPGLNQYGKWPQIDYSNNRDGGESQAIDAATLQGYADADAVQYDGPLEILTATVRPQDAIGKLRPGDDARFTIKDWRFPRGADVYQRVLGIQYDFDNETAQLQVDTTGSI